MSYSERPATLDDARYLATRLRAEDVAEVRALVGVTPWTALSTGVRLGRSTVGCYRGQPFGIYGVAPSGTPDVGCPWMLATPDLVKHQKFFLRNCARAVESLHDGYPLLFNYVDARNEVHIKWLRWCGFTFINLHPKFGVERRPFYEFVRISKCAS